MSGHVSPIREPLITGSKTYHQITEDICRPTETAPSHSWIITFIIYPDRQAAVEELYASNFQPYPVLDLTRNVESEAFERALELYDDARFEEAIESFQKINQTSGSNDKITFYLGISYMTVESFENASDTFNLLDSSSVYAEQKRWYLSLCYLMLNDMSQSKKLLGQIDAGAFEYERAQLLLKQLD